MRSESNLKLWVGWAGQQWEPRGAGNDEIVKHNAPRRPTSSTDARFACAANRGVGFSDGPDRCDLPLAVARKILAAIGSINLNPQCAAGDGKRCLHPLLAEPGISRDGAEHGRSAIDHADQLHRRPARQGYRIVIGTIGIEILAAGEDLAGTKLSRGSPAETCTSAGNVVFDQARATSPLLPVTPMSDVLVNAALSSGNVKRVTVVLV